MHVPPDFASPLHPTRFAMCPMVTVATAPGFCSGVTLTSTSHLHQPPHHPAVSSSGSLISAKFQSKMNQRHITALVSTRGGLKRGEGRITPVLPVLVPMVSVAYLQCDWAASTPLPPPRPSSIKRACFGEDLGRWHHL